MAATLRVGMFGGGIVGGGVVEILHLFRNRFEAVGANIEIAKICVRSLTKPRDYEVPPTTQFVTDYAAILDDPSINCVVEVMGGTSHAKDVVFAAIQRGKHVVTANKALVASHLTELMSLLKANPTVNFAYEAAVCGGIPIIHTLQTAYLSDDITKVMGIMNGTTNFMLTKMEAEGADYQAVLREAQVLGYAEADPTADVEGHDVAAKIALIAKLAFGANVPPDQIPTSGISAIGAVDFEYAKTLNSTIKLLGTARKTSDTHLSVYVSPVMVPLSHPLASARGAFNMVHVTSNNLISSSYTGPGAGRLPTANSIVSDLLRIAQGLTTAPFPLEAEWLMDSDYTARFYVRMTIKDGVGVIRTVGDLAARNSISIYSILQNPITDPNMVDFVVTTDECSLSQVVSFVEEMALQPFSVRKPLFMSLL